jgi:hypothetical protein
MPPKQIKKTEIKTEEPVIDQLLKDWTLLTKEEATIDEAKSQIIKRKEAMISKLWEHFNKNPTEQVLAEKPVEVKSVEKEVTKTPAKTKKAKATEEVEEDVPKTPVKKAPTKKVAAKEEKTEVEEKPVTKKVAAKEEKPVATKKVSAPPKGTAKPKVATETEVKKLENESSSDTDVDSLSSVSSESEGSDGGED